MARPWQLIKARNDCRRLGITSPRLAERRDCPRYEKCLTEAAAKNWSFIPCVTCRE